MSLLEIATWLQSTSLSVAIQSHGWVVPTLQSLHILMIGIVFISIVMIALRVLGRVRVDEPMASVWGRFAPFLWGGVLLMVVTGVLLTLSEPVREFMTLSFRLKMGLLVVGVVSAAAFGRTVRVGGVEQEPPFPARVRFAAVATMLLWLVIILLGRAIAYDDVVWGSWSPAVLAGAGST
jgi:prepilin signal peptidase PulO-like enzyme (type II secretory pathway)